MSRFSPSCNSQGVGTYILTTDQLNTMSEDLWSTNFLEWLAQKFNGDPTACIQSLRYYHGLKPKLTSSGVAAYLTVGNAVFNSAAGSPVSSLIWAQALTSDFADFDYGQFTVAGDGSYMSYEPFVKVELYAPFLGVIDLPTNEIVNHTFKLHYTINVTTGDGILKIIRVDTDKVIVTHGFNYGIDIPLSVQAKPTPGFAAAIGAVKGAKAAAGVATTAMTAGSASSIVAAGVATNATNHMVTYDPEKTDIGSGKTATVNNSGHDSWTTSVRRNPAEFASAFTNLPENYVQNGVSRTSGISSTIGEELLGEPYLIIRRTRRAIDLGPVLGYKFVEKGTVNDFKSTDTINEAPSGSSYQEYEQATEWGCVLKASQVMPNSELEKSPFAAEVYEKLKMGVRV